MRILITGRNHTIPADAMQSAVVPATQQVSLPTCAAACPSSARVERADLLLAGGRAASFLPGRKPQLAPRFGDGAFIFDATAGRWIVSPPGTTPGAGAAADLRHTQAAQTRPAKSLAPRPAGRAPHPVVEALTVALGLTVFGLVAGFFLVIA